VLIVCGEAQYEDVETETLLNPTIIIEVVSPYTEGADRGRKFACYRTLPSLTHYVLVEPNAPSIDLYDRQPDGRWLLTALSGLEATLTVDTAGLALPLADIYQRVKFPAAANNHPVENVPYG
jgi:Uma2 family endonuclease